MNVRVYNSKEIDDMGIGICLHNIWGAINPNGVFQIWWGKNKIPPWERENKREKNCPQHRIWRKAVFERDNYTCQICGQVGGDLNAHHIKSFKNYKSLRYVNNNGITLCEECHKKIHRGDVFIEKKLD